MPHTDTINFDLDEEMIDDFKIGDSVEIVARGKVKSLHAEEKNEGEGDDFPASMSIDVQDLKVKKSGNAFEQMAKEEDEG